MLFSDWPLDSATRPVTATTDNAATSQTTILTDMVPLFRRVEEGGENICFNHIEIKEE